MWDARGAESKTRGRESRGDFLSNISALLSNAGKNSAPPQLVSMGPKHNRREIKKTTVPPFPACWGSEEGLRGIFTLSICL